MICNIVNQIEKMKRFRAFDDERIENYITHTSSWFSTWFSTWSNTWSSTWSSTWFSIYFSTWSKSISTIYRSKTKQKICIYNLSTDTHCDDLIYTSKSMSIGINNVLMHDDLIIVLIILDQMYNLVF